MPTLVMGHSQQKVGTVWWHVPEISAAPEAEAERIGSSRPVN